MAGMRGSDRTHRRGRFDTFTVCVPGIEPLLERELAQLGVRGRRRRGGVSALMTIRQLYAANLNLRTATRIVVRIARFEAASFAVLERELGRIDWSPWIGADTPVLPRPSSHRSRLWHTGAIAERLLRVAPGRPAAPEEAPLRVLVRVVSDEVTVSIDSSGEPLHRRGWRGPTAKAPLRPTLAAAMLLSAGWPGEPGGAGGGALVDPFCGSGTIPIEAALLARNIAPGLARVVDRGEAPTGFAFQRWPGFEPGTWASVAGAAHAAVAPPADRPIVARDRDPGAVAATVDNATRAGVVDDLDIGEAVLSDLSAPAGDHGAGWLVTNPPYGRRVKGGRDRRDLYARLGQIAAARLPGWTVGMLVDDEVVAGHSGLPLTTAWAATNGGISVRYLLTP
jgi:putative N6-adenine-specific DNA methylase